MSATPKLVTIFGGSGFVGRYIARRMAKQGWRVRVAVRRPNEALFVRTYGVVGQVEPMMANIRDDASVRAAMVGADAVVNCVGILAENSRQTFAGVQADGAGRIARIAKELRVERLVHLSAIGADAKSESEYLHSKLDGEEQIKAHFRSAVILRPSIVFGPEDQFFNRFASLSKFLPIFPVFSAATKLQPVYVDDVAKAAEQAILGKAASGIYELGGPDVETMQGIVDRTLASVRRNRITFRMPHFAAKIKAWSLDLLQKLTLGVFTNTVITKDQLRSLAVDNVVAKKGIKTFKNLGISPVSMDAILDDYLYAHRPYGQYTELTESGKNLKA